MTIDRSTIRKQFATFLSDNLVGTSLPVQEVLSYQAADIRKSPSVIVTSSGSSRGSPLTEEDSAILLETHTFVIYAIKAVTTTDDVDAGDNAVIPVSDVSVFLVGMTVTVFDDSNIETAVVVDIGTEDIVVDTLTNSYTTPKVSIWTESQSEDMLDLIEKQITDCVKLANDEDNWMTVVPNGQSEVDVVEIGGNPYRHEMKPIRITVQDFV